VRLRELDESAFAKRHERPMANQSTRKSTEEQGQQGEAQGEQHATRPEGRQLARRESAPVEIAQQDTEVAPGLPDSFAVWRFARDVLPEHSQPSLPRRR
jgi:hypothetical protein